MIRLIPAVLLALVAWLAVTAPAQTPALAFPAAGDEFVGPFATWTNVKTAGAIADGVVDDTAAIQRALDRLGTSAEQSPVLFLPAGRYRITGTLTLSYRINVSVVGEHPDKTTLIWDGGPGGTMLVVNGVAYSRFTRLTFNGARQASVAVEQSWDGAQPHFDTGNEYADDRFVDVEYGIHGGFKDRGFAETSILRSHFIRNTRAGVALGNFNALDIWVWHSLFEDCAVGITNEPGAGNYHVYESVFRRSTTADLMMRNTGGFSARGNYSSGSKAFYVSPPMNHPATIDIQSNTIVDTADASAIRLGNHGPGLVMDNTFVSKAGLAGPAISWRSFQGSDVVSIGNTFTVPDPVSVNGRLIAFDDRIVDRATLAVKEPLLPATPPSTQRPIFEVPRGADAATIQRTIDTAVLQGGARPIVHFPYGTYAIDRTLVVPPGDLQLVGDGMGTALRWSRDAPGVVVRAAGPTRLTVRELQIHGVTKADGLVLTNVDQPGSRVSLNAVHLREGEATNLKLSRLENLDVQMIDIGHAFSARGVSIDAQGARATIYSGASAVNRLSYAVSGGARLLVRDIWYEGSATEGFARIQDRAQFTMQGSRIATTGPMPPAIALQNVDGDIALLTLTLDDQIAVTGVNTRANLLAMGVAREPQSPAYLAGGQVPGLTALLLNGRQRVDTRNPLGPGSRSVPDVGALNHAFVRRLLAPTRDTPGPTLAALPPSASDVRMFRVWITNGVNNLSISGASQ